MNHQFLMRTYKKKNPHPWIHIRLLTIIGEYSTHIIHSSPMFLARAQLRGPPRFFRLGQTGEVSRLGRRPRHGPAWLRHALSQFLSDTSLGLGLGKIMMRRSLEFQRPRLRLDLELLFVCTFSEGITGALGWFIMVDIGLWIQLYLLRKWDWGRI